MIGYKWWVIIAIGLFGVGLAIGLNPPAGVNDLIAEDIAALSSLGALLSSLPPLLIMLFIYAKNATALLLSFGLSPLLGLMPIFALTVNGMVISAISAIVIQEESLGFLLAGLLPHGIFELPAFIIGEAAALSFGALLILALVKKETRSLLPLRLKKSLRYLVIALILLVPAAIIETFVTPLLLT